jgi:hypothetical protein
MQVFLKAAAGEQIAKEFIWPGVSCTLTSICLEQELYYLSLILLGTSDRDLPDRFNDEVAVPSIHGRGRAHRVIA